MRLYYIIFRAKNQPDNMAKNPNKFCAFCTTPFRREFCWKEKALCGREKALCPAVFAREGARNGRNFPHKSKKRLLGLIFVFSCAILIL